MTLKAETRWSKTYTGPHGEAVITRNFGNKDRFDHYSVVARIDGEYKELAKRAKFDKAYAIAEAAIG